MTTQPGGQPAKIASGMKAWHAQRRERDVLLADAIEALRGLRAIIHDDLTHARQADHREAIAKSDDVIARAISAGAA